LSNPNLDVKEALNKGSEKLRNEAREASFDSSVCEEVEIQVPPLPHPAKDPSGDFMEFNFAFDENTPCDNENEDTSELMRLFSLGLQLELSIKKRKIEQSVMKQEKKLPFLRFLESAVHYLTEKLRYRVACNVNDRYCWKRSTNIVQHATGSRKHFLILQQQ
jgi:hypothetical protein